MRMIAARFQEEALDSALLMDGRSNANDGDNIKEENNRKQSRSIRSSSLSSLIVDAPHLKMCCAIFLLLPSMMSRTITGAALVSAFSSPSSLRSRPSSSLLSFPRQQQQHCLLFARREDRDNYYDGDEEEDYYSDDEEEDEDVLKERERRRLLRRKRRRRRRRQEEQYEFYGDNDNYDNLGGDSPFRSQSRDDDLDLPSAFGRRDVGWRLPDSVSRSLVAGVLVLGIGLGVTIDSQVNTDPKDLASRDAIDQAAPNPTLCAKMGASAMAFDQRVFVSFNPFNVYVSQADVKPACVLRDANVDVLKQRGLIDGNEIRTCKQNMNRWAFVGDLEDTPQISCVYQSQDAQNEFLSNPKYGIGEDYLDDDRQKLEEMRRQNNGKIVKGGLTNAQKMLLKEQK